MTILFFTVTGCSIRTYLASKRIKSTKCIAFIHTNLYGLMALSAVPIENNNSIVWSVLFVFVYLFICLFNRSLSVGTHLSPDGNRVKQNAQVGLKTY